MIKDPSTCIKVINAKTSPSGPNAIASSEIRETIPSIDTASLCVRGPLCTFENIAPAASVAMSRLPTRKVALRLKGVGRWLAGQHNPALKSINLNKQTGRLLPR